MNKQLLLCAAIVAASVGFSPEADASGTLIYGGMQYTCQHTCIITIGWPSSTISDSGGGWIRAARITAPI